MLGGKSWSQKRKSDFEKSKDLISKGTILLWKKGKPWYQTGKLCSEKMGNTWSQRGKSCFERGIWLLTVWIISENWTQEGPSERQNGPWRDSERAQATHWVAWEARPILDLISGKMCEHPSVLHGLGAAWKLKPDPADPPDLPDQADLPEMGHARHFRP